MQITVGKVVALLIAIGYAIAMTFAEHGVTRNVVSCWVVLLLPLVLIWFPEQLGSFKGYVMRGGWIDNETPAVLVSIMGWFFLVGLPVVLYILWSR